MRNGKKVGEPIQEKFAAIPLRLVYSDLYQVIGHPARDLYTCMVASLFYKGNGYRNTTKREVAYGPTDAKAVGFDVNTYYRALNKLLKWGVIRLVSPGGHGKKPVYDLMEWEYSSLVRPIEQVG